VKIGRPHTHDPKNLQDDACDTGDDDINNGNASEATILPSESLSCAESGAEDENTGCNGQGLML
jgi:hypothetical protein